MSFDSRGNKVIIGDKVICSERSIMIIPICTNGDKKPIKNGRVYINDNRLSSDENRRNSFLHTLDNCILHRDVILQRSDYSQGTFCPVLTVIDISGDYAAFSGNDSLTMHYHPLNKFIKIKNHESKS